jgi:dipeptidyl aminopeptidase/acylaminoacyl peptidase
MRLSIALITVAAVAHAETTDPRTLTATARAGAHPLSIAQLYNSRAIGDAVFSPDGKTIAFVDNLSGRRNLWTVPSDGGWPIQLTVSDERQAEPAWSPDGKWIAFTQDHEGDEQWDVLLVATASGEIVNLTHTPDVSEEAPAWSPDGKSLAYAVKPRSSSVYEIDVMDLATRTVRHLTTGTPRDRGNFTPRWSPDGRSIAYSQARADEKDSDVLVVKLDGGAPVRLTPHDGEHTFFATAFSPDGKQLLVRSDAHDGREQLALLDVATQKLDWITSGAWEALPGGFSPDGRTIAFSRNIDGEEQIELYTRADKKTRKLPLPSGVSTAASPFAFSRDGGRLLVFHEGPGAPRDLWTVATKGGAARQITRSLVGGLRAEDFVPAQLVHFSSGALTISAWLYLPFNAARDGKRPAVVYVHGGPTSQAMNGFARAPEYLASQGYVVIAPNYRGSTGYGKAFMDANRFDMGGGDLADVLAAADFVVKSGFVDEKKLVIMGGSYGGYMTMMGVTKAPERWAAGVAIVPFVNWFTEVKNEDPLLTQYDLATMGDPVKNKALWEERSPLFSVDKIRAPLILLAGAHDPRCPQSEARQVFDAVKKRGGVVELKVYDNEGHGFSRVENTVDAYERVARFLRAHVPPPEEKK